MKTTDIGPEVVMLIGPPGSGKTTYVNNVLNGQNKHYELLSTDNLITVWGEKDGLNYTEAFPKYIKKADKQFKIQFRQAINQRLNIIIDRTNMTAKGRDRLLSQLPPEYHRIAVVFDIDKEELKRRIVKRELETGKSIPDHILNSMINSFQPPTSQEFDEIRKI